MLRAVLFDVDFTLARPGPELGPDGYRRLGARYGLDARPVRATTRRARRRSRASSRHPELEHDEEIWVPFTERIIRGMGGHADSAYECAVEMTRAWEHAEHFELYEDALPVLEELRSAGSRSASSRTPAANLDEFVAHHGLQVDAALGLGRVRPHQAAPDDLPRGPRAARRRAGGRGDGRRLDRGRHRGRPRHGIPRAFLLDREGRYPEVPDRLPDLFALPAALGLARS